MGSSIFYLIFFYMLSFFLSGENSSFSVISNTFLELYLISYFKSLWIFKTPSKK